MEASIRSIRRLEEVLALELIENHRLDGIVYVAHEEGVYSLELFQRLHHISTAPRSIQL